MSDLIGSTNCRNIKYLSGNHDDDYFLSKSDMTPSHWSLLMGCHHSGACDDDAAEAAKYFEITDYDKAKEYLIGCGIEEETFSELYDDEDDESEMVNNEDAILRYYLWTLAGDIQERPESEVES
jgi:hypothetical protein